MVLVINKVDDKEIIMWWCITFLLNLKLNESRNQSAQSSLGSIELPKRTRSIQVRKPEIQQSKGKERSHIEGSRTGQETQWKISINDKLQQASNDDAAASWTKLCIYRIPQYLRDAGDDKAYIPQIVSLGPYHHGKKRLRNMDQHKWRALNRILKRNNQGIELYLDKVKELEERARSCYEGTISLSSNEFAEMMVLDSCFMLEIFRGDAEGFDTLEYSIDDPIFARGDILVLLRDMLMLENQIPLFILEELLSLQTDKRDQTGGVIRLAVQFFSSFGLTDEPSINKELKKRQSAIRRASTLSGQHCLDVFRQYLIQTETKGSHTDRVDDKDESRQRPIHWGTGQKSCFEVFRRHRQTETKGSHTNSGANKDDSRLIHCVTELKEAGIEFKRLDTDRFLDIKFKNGVLEIPRLMIHDGTKSLFLNLIAYEQSHLDCTGEITSYAVFMDSLINTAADVSYLHYKMIVENWLGNNDNVAELFNRLCQEFRFKGVDSYFSKLIKKVNEHYDRKWNVWKASLRRKYFNSPWAIISFLAAVMLLTLTSLQTFFTVYPYYMQNS